MQPRDEFDVQPDANDAVVKHNCNTCRSSDMDEGMLVCGRLFSAQIGGWSDEADAIKAWGSTVKEAGLWPSSFGYPSKEADGCPHWRPHDNA